MTNNCPAEDAEEYFCVIDEIRAKLDIAIARAEAAEKELDVMRRKMMGRTKATYCAYCGTTYVDSKPQPKKAKS